VNVKLVVTIYLIYNNSPTSLVFFENKHSSTLRIKSKKNFLEKVKGSTLQMIKLIVVQV